MKFPKSFKMCRVDLYDLNEYKSVELDYMNPHGKKCCQYEGGLCGGDGQPCKVEVYDRRKK